MGKNKSKWCVKDSDKFRFGIKQILNLEMRGMKTVTICGSMRFEKEMMAISFLLETKFNFCVLQCVYNTEQHDISEHELEMLAQAHYQ